jgi:hypothetical protein
MHFLRQRIIMLKKTKAINDHKNRRASFSLIIKNCNTIFGDYNGIHSFCA